MLVERATIRKVLQVTLIAVALISSTASGSHRHGSVQWPGSHHTTVAVLIPVGSRPGLGRCMACYHFDVIASVGNYSRTCGGDAVRSGSSQLSEKVTTFQRVAKKRKIYNNEKL